MGSITPFPTFSPECEVSTPPPAGSDTTKYFSRWSHMNVIGLPAAVIVPAVEEDIVVAIKYARENNYKLIPAGGTHGPFVPIDEKVVYLDMRKFNTIDIDESASTATLGGGTLTGDLLVKLFDHGLYTSMSNSNQVGMVGYILGGGISIFNGLHGLAMDTVRRIRVITASGDTIELDASSNGKEGELFNVLGGAGYGFGVITAITVRVWRIKDLGMTEDKLFKRQLIFQGSEIQTAAELFARLQAPPANTASSLVCLRAPLSTPWAGEPIIMVFVNSLGPADAAQKSMAPAFEEKYASKAIVAKTLLADWTSMNAHADEYNGHGGYKENHGVWAPSLSAEAIVAAYGSWLEVGEQAPSAKAGTNWVVAAKNPTGMLANDPEGKKFFPRSLRNKKIYTRISPWWTDRKEEEVIRKWAGEMVKILGPGNGDKVFAYGANLNKGIDMGTVYHPEQLEQIKHISKTWDPNGLFWNPVVDGV